VLQGAKMPGVVEQLQPPGTKTSSLITIPLALVGIALIIFAMVKLIKFAWFF
jgi:hypothetical protein